jgi:hypothetical protein
MKYPIVFVCHVWDKEKKIGGPKPIFNKDLAASVVR